MIRPLEKQFGVVKARRIRRLISGIDRLTALHGAERYYVAEMKRCLEAGILLGAVTISMSLLELILRNLSVKYRTVVPGTKIGAPRLEQEFWMEYDLEQETRNTLPILLKELSTAGVLTKKEAESVRTLYNSVRIPVLHALVGRFVRDRMDHPRVPSPISESHEFEEAFEKCALKAISDMVKFVKKYSCRQPH